MPAMALVAPVAPAKQAPAHLAARATAASAKRFAQAASNRQKR